MGFDFNRLRANAAADRNAFRYYREIQPTQSAINILESESKRSKKRGLKTVIIDFISKRPLLVTGGLMLTGGGIVYGLVRYFRNPGNDKVVQEHVTRMQRELQAYEENLRQM